MISKFVMVILFAICLYEIFWCQEWTIVNGESSFMDSMTNAIDEVSHSVIGRFDVGDYGRVLICSLYTGCETKGL